jgi:hypothetical protein
VKAIAALLVVANLVAFAWWKGWLDPWLSGAREPQRLAAQVAPEKLKVVPVSRLDRPAAPADVAEADRCLEVGPLDEAALARVAEWVATLGARARGEPVQPRYRVRFDGPMAPADLLARKSELAARAGSEPRRCAVTGPGAGMGMGIGPTTGGGPGAAAGMGAAAGAERRP